MKSRFVLIKLFSIFALFIPCFVFAGDVLPEFDTTCFTRDECIQARKEFNSDMTDKQAAEGFKVDEGNCTGTFTNEEGKEESWGKCLPAGKVITSIGIGGVNEYSDVADYIITVYNFALVIGGILAVVVIIVAGIQWIVAGGNSETITSAKKRIINSFIGLFLLYSSYFILNSINPWLVNFRLPQAWLVKPIKLATQFCQDLDDANLKLVKLDINKDEPDEIDKAIKKINSDDFVNSKLTTQRLVGPMNEGFSKNPLVHDKELTCGDVFAVSKSGGQYCRGSYCAEGGVCAPKFFDFKNKNFNKDDKGYACLPYVIAGFVTDNGFRLGDKFVPPFLDTGTRLIYRCKNKQNTYGSYVLNLELESWELGGREVGFYYLDYDKFFNRVKTICKGEENLESAYLRLVLDDTNAVMFDWVDEVFLVGKSKTPVKVGGGSSGGQTIEDKLNIIKPWSLAELKKGVIHNVDLATFSPD